MLSQSNGCEYVVIYEMLCLMSCNNNGRLENNVGEIIVPFTVDKLTRDLKYFSSDTIIVALELFFKLGLVYQDNSTIVISDMAMLVGSESSSAKRVRAHRNKALQCNTNVTPNVTQEYRDKSKEIRDIDIRESDISNNNNSNFDNDEIDKELEKLLQKAEWKNY